jgi:flavin-dependent dehydrogenase
LAPNSDYDVAIIGGGPAGSTAGTLLKKYAPNLRVLILERETFPRDHVGESQLPSISGILDEMGVWDKVEAAGFPIKIGATYKWGKSPELWDFEFVPASEFVDEPRPAKYEGQRKRTAFQVDRALYDQILLDHSAELGCEVRQATKVARVHRQGDAVDHLELEDGTQIRARWYVDASGHSGIVRRTMGVQVEQPTSLQNIAIWDYWRNTDWAVEIGVGGTRVQVISLGYGWIWFIPLGPDRTSVGLIVPAEYYKKSGARPDDLYQKALKEDARIASLMENATAEGNLSTTKDWSFIAGRIVGENWFLCGESAGFADPILAAGMSLAQAAGREVAYTIVGMDRPRSNPKWLKEQYDKRQRDRLQNHIRFADYWYTANGQFTDLKDFTSQIAADAGLDLDPERAWQWLATGGFIDQDLSIGTGGYSLTAVKNLGQFLSDLKPGSPLEENNVFRLDLTNATFYERANYYRGNITREDCYIRDGKVLPLNTVFEFLVDILQQETRLPAIAGMIGHIARQHPNDEYFRTEILNWVTQAMEAMVWDGWVKASYDPSLPLMPLNAGPTETVHLNRDSAHI